MAKELSKLLDYLRGLVKSRFYGKVIISFDDGKVTTVKTEHTVKISELNSEKSH